jgi:signal transduction histidine kinase
MLNDFISTNRGEIIRRTRARVATRAAPHPTREELTLGVPLFLDELVATLGNGPDHSDVIARDAALHGECRQQMGFTVAQVVRDYGDICQVVTQLAIELRAPISIEEFRTLNLCLDDAIARAVTEYTRVRERSISDEEIQRLGFLAHELRNFLYTARLSYDILKTGTVAIGGSTGAVLERSLTSLQALVDRTMAQVRLDAGVHHSEPVDISAFLEEAEAAGVVGAKDRGMSLTVERGSEGVAVEADRQLLGSAVSNLLQNGLKFTPDGGHVWLRTSASAERVVIEIEDQCGGLRPGQLDELFEGFQQKGRDKSGLGLGLVISKRAIEAVGGTLRARNNPEVGCVFTIDLPRLRVPG